MKKLALCLLACLMLFTGAHALENGMIRNDEIYSINELVAVGDTLYVMAETADGVMLGQWQRGDMDIRFAQTPLNYALYMYLDDALAVDDGSRIVSQLFTDGERLMSFDPVLGQIFEMRVEGEYVTFSDVVHVNRYADMYWDTYGYSKMLRDAVVDGNTLYWLTSEWNDEGEEISTLFSVDLTNGVATQLALDNAYEIELLEDGQLLVLTDDAQLLTYDPVTEGVSKTAAQPVTEIYDILYAPELNAALYLENQRVMGFKDLQEMMQYAYSPLDPWDAVVLGDAIVISDGANLLIRTLEEGYQPTYELTVMSAGYEDLETVRQYTAENPDTAIYWYQDYSGYLFDNSYEAMAPLLAENQLDIAIVTLSLSGYEELVESGLCADLSGYDALQEKLATMYPVYTEAVKENSSYYAAPVAAISWGWSYDRTALEMTGLSADELPTNLVDLCAFVTRWNNELLDQNPEISLFNFITDTRTYIMGLMLEQYGAWCEQQYGQLKFDTPEFHELLAAIESMQCDRIDRAADRYYEYGLLNNGIASVGSFEWSRSEAEGYAVWLPMSLTADTEWVEPTTLEIAFVNARSEHKDIAAELLGRMLGNLPDEAMTTLYSDRTEAVKNPYYNEWLEGALNELDWLKAEQEMMGGSEEYDDLIAMQEEYIETAMPLYEWQIRAEDIAFYRETILPHVSIARANCINNWMAQEYVECYELAERYLCGEVTEEQLIRQLDALQ